MTDAIQNPPTSTPPGTAHLSIERIHRRRQPGMAVTARRPAGELIERDRPDARGQTAEGIGPHRMPDEIQQRNPRHDPERGVQRVGDGLRRVRAGRADDVVAERLIAESGDIDVCVVRPLAAGPLRRRVVA